MGDENIEKEVDDLVSERRSREGAYRRGAQQAFNAAIDIYIAAQEKGLSHEETFERLREMEDKIALWRSGQDDSSNPTPW